MLCVILVEGKSVWKVLRLQKSRCCALVFHVRLVEFTLLNFRKNNFFLSFMFLWENCISILGQSSDGRDTSPFHSTFFLSPFQKIFPPNEFLPKFFPWSCLDDVSLNSIIYLGKANKLVWNPGLVTFDSDSYLLFVAYVPLAIFIQTCRIA